nr:MAG TPA: hypothetical protein [Caudoviricetes sp.]
MLSCILQPFSALHKATSILYADSFIIRCLPFHPSVVLIFLATSTLILFLYPLRVGYIFLLFRIII